jgi:hypothetical protein
MLVGLKRISTALGLLAASVASAHGQEAAPAGNQATANAVASTLQSSKALARYRIDIEAQNGVVTLTGSVKSHAQKAEALARVRQVAGVSSIVDRMNVTGDRGVRAAQYQMAIGGHRFGGAAGGEVIYDGAPAAPVAAGPVMGGPMPEAAAGAPGAGPAGVAGAWPGTPGGYPTTHPWAAWASVSPAAPYPEIPLGWERVTLRWDDGIWWLDFKKNYSRPFFTPWPFQLWAY